MRTLTSAAAAVASGQVVPMAMLVEMDLTQPLNLNTSSLTLTLNGVTYTGAGSLGKIDAIKETSATIPKVGFTLAGVQPTLISLALQENVQGKAVRIKMAIFDPSTGAVLDTRLRYSGFLDTMSISDDPKGSVIAVTSESALLQLLRPVGLYYNDLDQQALHPGDFSMEFVNDQVQQVIVWPSAAFFFKH